MSLGVVIKGTEGVVLAADSRVTLQATRPKQTPIQINFDNATKLITFQEPHNYVAAVTYGLAVIGKRTAHSFVPEFEQTFLSEIDERINVKKYAEKLSEFFLNQWNKSPMPKPSDFKGPGMTFIVGGYDPGQAYGSVFLFDIPHQPEPKPRNKKNFGMTWGGQLQIATRIIHGWDPRYMPIIKEELGLDDQKINELTKKLKSQLEFPIPYDVLPLQDCIDLAIFLVKSTVQAQQLAIGVRGVGGPIEVAVIRRTKEVEFIQKKKLRGEIK